MITEPRKLNEEEELALKKIFEDYKKTFIEPSWDVANEAIEADQLALADAKASGE
jgi:hypothetical protein